MIFDQTIDAGYHSIAWQPAPADAPTGIYRMHVQSPTAKEWRDVMLYHSLEELPEDLRPIVANWK